jgi:hypothetical protein
MTGARRRLIQAPSGPPNKGMNLSNGALVTSAAPFAGYAQRSADRKSGGRRCP